MTMLKLVAKVTKMGNPRSLYVLINEDGAYTKAWDIGYLGEHAMPEEYRDIVPNAIYVEITPSFYTRVKKTYC